jgi:predicted phosphodiesterase
VAQGGPQPAECLELLRTAGARTVLGNSDAFLLDPASTKDEVNERQLAQREWALARLSGDDLADLRSFEPTIEVPLDDLRLLCFHGTPHSYEGVVLPADPPDAFDGTGADVLAGGHVHVPQLRRVGDALYVNPGSVGAGYDHLRWNTEDFHLDPWASYAIVEARSVEFHRVPFDLDELVAAISAGAFPDAEHSLLWWRRHP